MNTIKMEKCHACHKEFEDKPQEEELTINVKGKEIKIRGILHRCPNCNETYTTENEALELIQKFEAECKKNI